MASQAIGSLFVSLGIDTAAFSAGIKQAQGRIEAFATGLSKRFGALGNVPGLDRVQASLAAVGVGAGAALGAGAAAAAFGLGALSINAMNAAAEIKNLSTLANTSPEEFQKLAFAAQSVGIAQDKMADILKDVNDKVGEFVTTGGGELKDFFEQVAPKVGVTAEQFRGLSGPQALGLYVDTLDRAGVNQQQFTYFMEAIADEATALVPLLRNGGKAAQEYGARLEALGGVMDNATVARLAGMKTALTEVGVVIGGLGTQIGAAFAPVVQALAQAFTAMLSKGAPLRVMFDGLAAALGKAAEVFAALINITTAFWGAVNDLAASVVTLVNELTGIGSIVSWLWDHTIGGAMDVVIWFSQLIEVSGGFGGALAALGRVAGELFSRIGAGASFVKNSVSAMASHMEVFFLDALNRMVGGWVEVTWAIADGMNSLFGTSLSGADATITQELARSKLAALDAAEGYEAAASAAAGVFTAPLSSLAEINAQIAASSEAAADGMNNLGAGIAAAGNAADGGKGLKKLKEKMTELQKATEEWRDTMKSAFTDFITKGGSFKDVLSQIIGKLAEMLANSAFDGLFSAIGGNNIIGGILGAFGIGANANGTNNWRGGLSRVNERGGEIMNLPRGTQVIPHDISKRMAKDAAGAGGSAAISISLSEGLEASILERTGAQTVQIMRASDRRLPDRMAQINKSPRTR